MKNDTLVLMLLGAAIVYLFIQNQKQPMPVSSTTNPYGGQLPAGGSVEGIVENGLGFINRIFDTFSHQSIAQTQPMAR